jgi:hypothetical protein
MWALRGLYFPNQHFSTAAIVRLSIRTIAEAYVPLRGFEFAEQLRSVKGLILFSQPVSAAANLSQSTPLLIVDLKYLDNKRLSHCIPFISHNASIVIGNPPLVSFQQRHTLFNSEQQIQWLKASYNDGNTEFFR